MQAAQKPQAFSSAEGEECVVSHWGIRCDSLTERFAISSDKMHH